MTQPSQLMERALEVLGNRVKLVNDCWIYNRPISSRYPRLKVDSKCINTHRLVWTAVHAQKPPEGMCVCHKCDNPHCVRPSHLFLATNPENTADKVKKNRQARGERVNQKYSHITAELVQKIRSAHQQGCLIREIAARFGTSKSNVDYIVRRVYWKHVI